MLKIDTKKWSLRQYRNFTVAIRSNDLDSVLDSLSALVVEWDYAKCKPSNVECWLDELNLEQWLEITEEILKQITEAFNTKN